MISISYMSLFAANIEKSKLQTVLKLFGQNCSILGCIQTVSSQLDFLQHQVLCGVGSFPLNIFETSAEQFLLQSPEDNSLISSLIGVMLPGLLKSKYIKESLA